MRQYRLSTDRIISVEINAFKVEGNYVFLRKDYINVVGAKLFIISCCSSL